MVGLKEEQTIILTVMQMSDQLEYDKPCTFEVPQKFYPMYLGICVSVLDCLVLKLAPDSLSFEKIMIKSRQAKLLIQLPWNQ